MLKIHAKTVYVDPLIYEKENCRERFERMLPFIQCKNIVEYNKTAQQEVAKIGNRRHGKDAFANDAVLIFTPWEAERYHWYFHWRDEAGAHGGACQPGLELNLVDGCVFRCAYCGFGRSVHFSLDVEHFLQELDHIVKYYSKQTLFKFSNMTDLPAFEPELDMVPQLVHRFSKENQRYLMLFTKSDNVDFLTELNHNQQTIISWSITCDTASRLVDKRAPEMAARIEAMRKMQAAGYLVRARLSPIIPVKNWRDEYSALFETLFRKVKPDLVTMELLGWMNVDDLLQIIDREMLDPDAVQAAIAARSKLARINWGPFTQQTHTEIYRFCIETVQKISPQTPVSVCHGTPETWQDLGTLMKMDSKNFICNCGPNSTPGGELYRRFHPKL